MTIRAQHKPSRVIDRKYREWVKTRPCTLQSTLCVGPIDPHHVIPKGQGRTGSKVSDRRCIALCRHHHENVASYSRYRDTFEFEIQRRNTEYDTLYPVKRETRIRTRTPRVKRLEIECECPELHKVTPGKAGEITSVSVKYWCRRRQAWMTARF